MPLVLFCLPNPPGTLSFFTSKQTLQSTLVVTTEIEHITASFLSEGIRDEQTGDNREMQTSIFNKPEYINVGLEFGRAYDEESVDMRSLSAYSEGNALPVSKVSNMEGTLILSFDYQVLKSLLGHGSHIVFIEGMFKNGWIRFSAEGTLEIIDEDVVAEQEAIKLNEKKLFDEAEKALLIAEETRKKDDVEYAGSLIAKLPDGEKKEAMEKRLEAIKVMEEEGKETEATADEEETESNGGNPTVSEDVYRPADVTVLQDEIDSLLQETGQTVFMDEDDNEKVSDKVNG